VLDRLPDQQDRNLHSPRIELRHDGVPHFHFPEQPQPMIIDGRKVFIYIPEEQTRQLVSKLCTQVDLHAARNIIVPQKGGEWVFQRLAEAQGIAVDDPRVRRVKTVRSPGGHSVQIVNPEVIEDVRPSEDNIVIEDLLDDGLTAETIFNLTGGRVFALYAKVTTGAQSVLPVYATVAATIDKDKWVGANGSDYGTVAKELYGYPDDFPRQDWNLTVMPESLATDNSIY
jgi:hypothetical protein